MKPPPWSRTGYLTRPQELAQFNTSPRATFKLFGLAVDVPDPVRVCEGRSATGAFGQSPNDPYCLSQCPQSGSNRHWTDFKSAASANWAMGAAPDRRDCPNAGAQRGAETHERHDRPSSATATTEEIRPPADAGSAAWRRPRPALRRSARRAGAGPDRRTG